MRDRVFWAAKMADMESHSKYPNSEVIILQPSAGCSPELMFTKVVGIDLVNIQPEQ